MTQPPEPADQQGRASTSARRRRRRAAVRSAQRAAATPLAADTDTDLPGVAAPDGSVSVAETIGATDAVEPPEATGATTTTANPNATPDAGGRGKPRSRRLDNPSRDGGLERGLRDLVGAGRSQLGVSGALRGRDVNRPTDDDLAEAEQNVTLVRRNWKPPTERS